MDTTKSNGLFTTPATGGSGTTGNTQGNGESNANNAKQKPIIPLGSTIDKNKIDTNKIQQNDSFSFEGISIDPEKISVQKLQQTQTPINHEETTNPSINTTKIQSQQTKLKPTIITTQTENKSPSTQENTSTISSDDLFDSIPPAPENTTTHNITLQKPTKNTEETNKPIRKSTPPQITQTPPNIHLTKTTDNTINNVNKTNIEQKKNEKDPKIDLKEQKINKEIQEKNSFPNDTTPLTTNKIFKTHSSPKIEENDINKTVSPTLITPTSQEKQKLTKEEYHLQNKTENITPLEKTNNITKQTTSENTLTPKIITNTIQQPQNIVKPIVQPLQENKTAETKKGNSTETKPATIVKDKIPKVSTTTIDLDAMLGNNTTITKIPTTNNTIGQNTNPLYQVSLQNTLKKDEKQQITPITKTTSQTNTSINNQTSTAQHNNKKMIGVVFSMLGFIILVGVSAFVAHTMYPEESKSLLASVGMGESETNQIQINPTKTEKKTANSKIQNEEVNTGSGNKEKNKNTMIERPSPKESKITNIEGTDIEETTITQEKDQNPFKEDKLGKESLDKDLEEKDSNPKNDNTMNEQKIISKNPIHNAAEEEIKKETSNLINTNNTGSIEDKESSIQEEIYNKATEENTGELTPFQDMETLIDGENQYQKETIALLESYITRANSLLQKGEEREDTILKKYGNYIKIKSENLIKKIKEDNKVDSELVNKYIDQFNRYEERANAR